MFKPFSRRFVIQRDDNDSARKEVLTQVLKDIAERMGKRPENLHLDGETGAALWKVTDEKFRPIAIVREEKRSRQFHRLQQIRDRLLRTGSDHRWMWIAPVLHEEDLDLISTKLRNTFAAERIPLSTIYELRTEKRGKKWRLIDWRSLGSSQQTSSAGQPQIYDINYDGEGYDIQNWRKRRDYDPTPLPTLRDSTRDSKISQEVLLKLYSEVCSSWRQLTEVRFKLLGLVPVISGAILVSLLSRAKDEEGLTPISRTIIAAFGLATTVGVYIYDKRNTELYDDLISRARKIEYELGVDTGHFLGRLQSNDRMLGLIKIQHDFAIKIIYGMSMLAWIVAWPYIWRKELCDAHSVFGTHSCKKHA